ncbi:oxidoreductase, aldo/keto reductase family protein [Ostertagia ostertagi]
MTAQNKSVTVKDIWHGLEGVYKKGLTRAIGVSNWNGEQIERVLKTATVPIHNLQVELHLYWPQHELHEICKKHNISLTSYATLGSPGRANFMAEFCYATPLDRGIAIIPKSVKPKRVVENFSIFDFSLTNDEIKLLESNTKHRQRLFTDDFMIGHPEDPFKNERKALKRRPRN